MKKLLLVMNPCSGTKRAKRFLADVIDIFNRGGYEVNVYITAARGDATTLVTQRAAEFDTIVCIGGDGTFNETITGLHASGADVPIGYIPAGSTNDFASSLHLSKDFVQAARDIVEGTPHPIDIGRFNGRYFSYIASFGAFTRASYSTSQNLKNALGHLAYLLAGIKEIPAIRGRKIRFTLPNGLVLEDEYIFGAISNCTSMAGVLTLDPELVDLSDGLFELLLIRKPQSLIELNDCVLALTTQDYHTPMLTFVSTESVNIDAPADMDWTLDGEREKGAEHCFAENLHHSIRIITNSTALLEK